MDVKDALAIIELALSLAKTITEGTPASGDVAIAQALEQLGVKVAAAYQAEVGQPMDLSKLTYEAPIE